MTPTPPALDAPRCPKVRPWQTWRARLAGRRDARGPRPGPDAHLPYTRHLHSLAAANEALISRALHAAVEPIDAELARRCATIRHLRVQRANDQAAEATHTAAHLGDPHGSAGVRAARQASLSRTAQATQWGQIAAHTERLAALLATRHHLLEQARALAASHRERYAALTAAHQRGWARQVTRRDPSPTPAPTPPQYVPAMPWVHGDLPLLIATINPEDQSILHWALHQFEVVRHDNGHAPGLAPPAPARPK